jgi:hypothetical protein
MQRRTLLGLGLAGAALMTVGAAAAWLHEPAWRDGHLLAPGRRVLGAVAGAVLDGSLPDDPGARGAALEAHLQRVQVLLRAMPPHTHTEVDRLLTMLATPPVRIALTGLSSSWNEAPTRDVQAALQSMRMSSLQLRRQIYGALRDLTHAAYFSDASTWPLLRYPGPNAVL